MYWFGFNLEENEKERKLKQARRSVETPWLARHIESYFFGWKQDQNKTENYSVQQCSELYYDKIEQVKSLKNSKKPLGLPREPKEP